MAETRRIQKIAKSRPTIEGAGVHLHRAIGWGPPEQYDPFLLLDDFRSDEPEHYKRGFPWHPHRGMETITYVLRGEVAHADSLGNSDSIAPGDVQWMTAGSGIIHQEMPKGDSSGAMHGFQLWANLPAANKMMEPRYRGIRSEQIPSVHAHDGTQIRVIAGSVAGTTGPVRDIVTQPEYLDVTVAPGQTFTHPTPRGHTVFAYVIGGRGVFGEPEAPGGLHQDDASDGPIGDRQLVLFGDGDAVSVVAGIEPLRFLLVSGKPIREPIAWQGPIVMNTEDELRTAFAELDAGTFIKRRRA
jgi:quercetin 2,3-dioxygenase